MIFNMPKALQNKALQHLWSNGYIINPPYPPLSAKDLMHVKAHVEREKQARFGRLFKEFPVVGELRRQKKEPHKEVLYIWVDGDTAPNALLRAVSNSDNDQLTSAIQNAGLALTFKKITQQDAEQVLDLLYAELGRRVNA